MIESSKFDSIFIIEKYFNLLRRKEIVKVVPFSIIATMFNYDCDHLFQGKEILKGFKPLYCNDQEYVDQYIHTGSKLLGCENCTLYIK